MFAKAKPSNNSSNTRYKFQAQLVAHEQSFDTASNLLRKSQLRQTKLSLSKDDNKLKYDGFVDEHVPKIKAKHEFVYMPVSDKRLNIKKLNRSFCGVAANKEPMGKVTRRASAAAAAPAVTPLSKPGRNLISLIGRVDFCIKMHKQQPNLNVIWNVYAKLLRIIVGKHQEHTLLLRNDNHGPILQSIYYDFEGDLSTLTNGCFVRVVGRFVTENRLQTFKVEQVSTEIWQQNFVRLENLTKYILMQNNVPKV